MTFLLAMIELQLFWTCFEPLSGVVKILMMLMTYKSQVRQHADLLPSKRQKQHCRGLTLAYKKRTVFKSKRYLNFYYRCYISSPCPILSLTDYLI